MSPWAGRLFFGANRLLYVGAVGATTPHAHHAFQLVSTRFAMTLADERGCRHRASAFVVPADAAHSIVEHVPLAAVLYVDPDDAVGRRLRRADVDAADGQQWQAAAPSLASVAPSSLPATWREAQRIEDAMLNVVAPDSTPPTILHPAVKLALRTIADSDADSSLDELARAAGLSASRLSHAFAEDVGIPLKRYRLWIRLRRAAAHLQRDATITDAAHAAGFTDSAHMNRTFRQMFGISPSDVVGVAEWVVAPAAK